MNSGAISPNASPPLQPIVVVRKMEATVSNPSMGVEDLYRIAIDPSSTQKQLRDAWDSTKSTRVRKAVASNPNCDSTTMCMAARLYLKEVIANPSFELLNLFNEDKFVKQIYDAYSDPQLFCKTSKLHTISNKSGNRINTSRALLTSPNLCSAKILETIWTTLSGAELSRELKDVDVKANVKKIISGNLVYFRLPLLISFRAHDLINDSQVTKALSKSPAPCQYYTPKGQYAKFVKTSVPDYQLLYRFIYVNRPSNVRDVIKSVKGDPDLQSDDCLDAYAALYRDFLAHDVIRARAQTSRNNRKYGWSNRVNLGSSDFSYYLSDLLWTVIASRNISKIQTLDDLDLSALYRDISRTGLDRDFGPYKCQIELEKVYKTITSRLGMCKKLLELEDDRAFMFFLSSGIIWREWYGKTVEGTLESQVLSRFHRINEDLFKSGLEPLCKLSYLDNFPTIKISKSNGTEYNPDYYFCDESVDRKVPTVSGKIEPEVIAEMAVRGIGD
jgi:hypothetical protein